jgi:hypothetical protein
LGAIAGKVVPPVDFTYSFDIFVWNIAIEISGQTTRKVRHAVLSSPVCLPAKARRNQGKANFQLVQGFCPDAYFAI